MVDVAVSCGYDTQFAVILVMGYTISLFTWSILGYLSDYTQKSTTPILALKLSVSVFGCTSNPLLQKSSNTKLIYQVKKVQHPSGLIFRVRILSDCTYFGYIQY